MNTCRKCGFKSKYCLLAEPCRHALCQECSSSLTSRSCFARETEGCYGRYKTVDLGPPTEELIRREVRDAASRCPVRCYNHFCRYELPPDATSCPRCLISFCKFCFGNLSGCNCNRTTVQNDPFIEEMKEMYARYPSEVLLIRRCMKELGLDDWRIKPITQIYLRWNSFSSGPAALPVGANPDTYVIPARRDPVVYGPRRDSVVYGPGSSKYYRRPTWNHAWSRPLTNYTEDYPSGTVRGNLPDRREDYYPSGVVRIIPPDYQEDCYPSRGAVRQVPPGHREDFYPPPQSDVRQVPPDPRDGGYPPQPFRGGAVSPDPREDFYPYYTGTPSVVREPTVDRTPARPSVTFHDDSPSDFWYRRDSSSSDDEFNAPDEYSEDEHWDEKTCLVEIPKDLGGPSRKVLDGTRIMICNSTKQSITVLETMETDTVVHSMKPGNTIFENKPGTISLLVYEDGNIESSLEIVYE